MDPPLSNWGILPVLVLGRDVLRMTASAGQLADLRDGLRKGIGPSKGAMDLAEELVLAEDLAQGQRIAGLQAVHVLIR